ncbi:MAG: hypothetical protein PHZ26_05900 [Candidatus Gracilibacteria bacterium]|nr:hypothetical protein [Candidatus Gracilibacteria bacterium]MDD2909246.1 hypothetical protein [Candidatus Gracilibacteria bacterium]
MNNKFLLFSISTFLIICSFFVGYFFNKNEYSDNLNSIQNKKTTIELKKTANKIEITNPSKNIEIKLNGEVLDGSGIVIEK